MDGHRVYHTKWSKPDRKIQISYDITYMSGEENGNPLQYSCLKILWMKEPGGLQLSLGSQRVGHDWVTNIFTFTFITYMWNLKKNNDTNELTYKTETDAQKTNLLLPKGNRQGGIH